MADRKRQRLRVIYVKTMKRERNGITYRIAVVEGFLEELLFVASLAEPNGLHDTVRAKLLEDLGVLELARLLQVIGLDAPDVVPFGCRQS